MRRIIPLVGGEAYVFSETEVAKEISIYFMNAYAFICMPLNEAVHLTSH